MEARKPVATRFRARRADDLRAVAERGDKVGVLARDVLRVARRIPLPTYCPGPRPRASYRVAFRPIRERRLRAATATVTAVLELFLRRRR